MIEISVVSELQSHSNEVNNTIFFGEPINRIVSSSDDKTMIIWDSLTLEKIKTLRSHASRVYHVIKWNEDSILSCGKDALVCCHSIIPPNYPLVFSKNIFMSTLAKLFKVDDSKYIAFSLDDEVRLYEYPHTLLKEVKIRISFIMKCPIISHCFRNCFYFNSDETLTSNPQLDKAERPVFIINMKNLDILHHIGTHDGRIDTITSFKKSENIEILIAGGVKEYIYIYVIEKFINNKIFSSRLSRKISVKDELYSTYVLGKRYLLAGTGKGLVIVYDIQNDFKVIGRNVVHEDRIYDLNLLSQSTNEACVMSSSRDHCISKICVKGVQLFDFQKHQIEVDLTERIDFLFHNHDFFVFSRNSMVCQINLKNIEIGSLFKSLMSLL